MAKVNCLNIAGTVANKLLTMRNNTLSDSHLIIKRTCNGQLRSNAAGNLPGSNLPATLPGNALAALGRCGRQHRRSARASLRWCALAGGWRMTWLRPAARSFGGQTGP